MSDPRISPDILINWDVPVPIPPGITEDTLPASALAGTGNLARIGHDSFTLRSGVTVTASSQTAGWSAAAILNPLTYERWMPIVLPATLIVDLGGNAAIADYVGLAAHNLGTTRCNFAVAYSTNAGVSWTEIASRTPGDNRPIMELFDPVLARHWKLTVSGGTTVPFVGVFFVGKALVMQRRIYGGVAPPRFNRDTKVITNTSETGQNLGRSVVRAGIPQSFTWNNLERNWVDDNIPAFINNQRDHAYFVAWRPESHAHDVIYGESESDPKLTNQGVANFMTMSITMRGLVNE